jgi:hypothetical protein
MPLILSLREDGEAAFWRCLRAHVRYSTLAKGYYEHVLRDNEDSKQIAFYIIANPVRAGLVQSPDQYLLSRSDSWSIGDLMTWVTKE